MKKSPHTTGRRSRTFIEIIFLFIVPVALIYWGIIPRGSFVPVLAIYTSFVILLVLHEHWSLKTLDIRFDNIRKTAIPYLIFTAAGVAAIIVLASLLEKEILMPGNLYVLFFLWSLPIGFVQEFLYRGFLMHELHRVYTSVGTVIFVNAVLFAFLHILYTPAAVIVPITFVGGLAFAYMYHKYPNLLLISISHGILNFVAIVYSFF